MRVAVFLERDGVLNKVRTDNRHQVGPMTVGEFELFDGALQALERLKQAGFLLIVTTNQPGLSQGVQSRRELDYMHERLRQLLPVDDIMVCPHDESDDCPCHKPRPGMLLESAFKWHLDLDHSFVVSDKWQDAEAALQAGCTSLLLNSPWNGSVHHDFLMPNLKSAVDKILHRHAIIQSGEGWTTVPTHLLAAAESAQNFSPSEDRI